MLCDVAQQRDLHCCSNVSMLRYKTNGKCQIACTSELWMHLEGLLSTQEARVVLGYRLVRLLRFFGA